MHTFIGLSACESYAALLPLLLLLLHLYLCSLHTHITQTVLWSRRAGSYEIEPEKLLVPDLEYPYPLIHPFIHPSISLHTYIQSCGAVRAGLYEIEPEKLLVPDLEYADFEKAAKRTRPSVAPEELDRFTEWTAEFGQEG